MRAHGVSLIEALVALLILSFGMLAVATLQLQTRRGTAEAGQRGTAAQLAYSMAERLRANSSPAGLAAYAALAAPYPQRFAGRGAMGARPQPDCTEAGTRCSPEALAAHDLWHWEQLLDGAEASHAGSAAGGLVLPTGCISAPPGGGAGLYSVAIAWRGAVAMPSAGASGCGREATGADGARIYGAQDEYRRTLELQVFVAARTS